MCLVAYTVAPQSRFRFVLASNRDEFFHRAAAPMAWWTPASGMAPILSGRDLTAGGTWLGLTADARLALVTNVREPGRVVAGARSRGELVPQWLQQPQAPALHDATQPLLGDLLDSLLDALLAPPRNGFNFLAADLASGHALWATNRPPQWRALAPGAHGVSNAALDTPWPKLVRLQQRLDAAVAGAFTLPALREAAFAALADGQPAPDADLPATGVPLQRERQLSPAFIRIDSEAGVYGTRCSTLVIVEDHAPAPTVHVVERRFDTRGVVEGDSAFSFALPVTLR